jgi:integrase
MSIRKRILSRTGDVRWYCDYKDGEGKRRARQFETKREAEAFMTDARAELRDGIHTPSSVSVTVNEAAAYWIQRAELDGLETSTVLQYRQHADLHICPLLGGRKLSQLSRPAVEAFKDKLLETKSRPMSRAILASLKGIIKEAQRRGLVGHNVAADVTVRISKRDEDEAVIPTKDHIKAILTSVPDRWRPLIVTAVLTGLRCSELRGLMWEHVDFAAGVIRVRQRADLRNAIGAPKSKAGRRDVPMSPMVVNTLKAWKLACPVTAQDLVFPSDGGRIVTNGTIHRSCWGPLQRAAGMVDANGLPLYTFHALRHAAASLFIEMGWLPKKVQTVMGHSTIQVTYDVYGHLWPSPEDDRAAMAQIEARLGIG